MSYQIALDVGGTFTDGILLDTGSNRVLVAKALTTPSDPGDGITAVAESLISQARAPDSGFDGPISRAVHEARCQARKRNPVASVVTAHSSTA